MLTREDIPQVAYDLWSKFLKNIDEDIELFEGEISQSDSINKTIYFDFLEYPFKSSDEQLQMEILRERNIKIDVSLPTFIMLHELGHIMTINKLEKKEKYLNEYDKKVSKISKIYNKRDKLNAYKNLTLERLADEYAYQIYKEKYMTVKHIDKTILSLL